MEERLATVLSRFGEIEQQLADPEVLGNRVRYQELVKERAGLERLARLASRRAICITQREENRTLAGDPELGPLAQEELTRLDAELETLDSEVRQELLPKDPRDERNVFLEIRAGTGGEESALFAAELFRMYVRVAEARGWRTEVMDSSESEKGGFKEIIVGVQGRNAYSTLKYESGVHRVQRVPVTEANGRIHTSAVTVAVLAEADEVELDIKPEDLRITVCRSGGHGGQSVNTTDSAVRIVHIPTNTMVVCQDEKSQHKNKAKALRVLRARLLEHMRQEEAARVSADRKSQVGTGDRSEKIRTYNFPQNRVTDHRIGLTVHSLDRVLNGDLDAILEALRADNVQRQLGGAAL